MGNDGLILEMDKDTKQLTQIEGPSQDTTFFGVWGASSEDIWAVGMTQGGQGPGAMWRRQGGEWAPYVDASLGESPDRTTYMKVDGTSSDNVWFVGSNGLSPFDGTSLETIPTDTETATSSAPVDS